MTGGATDGAGVAVGSELIDHGSAGVAEPEEFRDLVESFAHIAGGNGGYWEDQGYQWYAGI